MKCLLILFVRGAKLPAQTGLCAISLIEVKRPPIFTQRTRWNLQPNRLALLAEQRRRAGLPLIDLTESNPTRCGFQYEEQAILEALSSPQSLSYEPEARGLLPAREAVCGYYAGQNISVPAEHILLTAGSSESYSFLFRLLAEPGDNVLVPEPGYPLFEFLSRLHDIELIPYSLEYHQNWEIAFGSVEAAVTTRTRAVIVVNPNNPTGSILRGDERRQMEEFCRQHGLLLIADEVFLDYCFPEAKPEAGSFASESAALTFTLSGLSKSAALPQMKLGWIVVSGPEAGRSEALSRLEIIADTYLSVGTPVQAALPPLLATRHGIQRQICGRTTSNLQRLDELLSTQPACSRFRVDAGWSAILRVPNLRTDEEWALEVLERDGVLVHPGHFFNFSSEGYLVVSLLPAEKAFDEGISRLLARIGTVALFPIAASNE